MKIYTTRFYDAWGRWTQTIIYNDLIEAKAAGNNWKTLHAGNSYDLIYEVKTI